MNPDTYTWFNSLQITLYVREAMNVTESQLEELQQHVMDKIPGYDFESHHMPIMHHDELCI